MNLAEVETGTGLLILAAVGFGAWYVYDQITSPTGWGSTNQNGQQYSLLNQLSLSPNAQGHIYDSTGSVGAALAQGNAQYQNTLSGGANLGTYEAALSAFAQASGYANGLQAQSDPAWPAQGATIQAGFQAWVAAGYPPLPTDNSDQ